MPKLKVVTAKKLLKWLELKGFRVVRQKGSHASVRGLGLTTTIPIHSGDWMRGTTRKILKDLEIPVKIYEKEIQ